MEFNMTTVTLKEYITSRILTEQSNVEVNADLIYQKLLDVLDNAHIDFDDDEISFHIGRVIKNSKINISMVIRPGDSDVVRLGKNTEDDA